MGNWKNRRYAAMEMGKNVLIFLLICSAVLLTLRLQRYGGVDEEQGSGVQQKWSGRQGDGLVLPVKIGLIMETGGGLHAAMYDSQQVEDVFSQTSTLLREVLGSVSEAEQISLLQWREAQESAPGIYLEFLEELPFSVLFGWLSGQTEVALQAQSMRILISGKGDGVALLYQMNGEYYACDVPMISSARVEGIVGTYSGNGSAFAFQSEHYAQALSGDMLLSGQAIQMAVYSAKNPFEEEPVERLWEAAAGQLLQGFEIPTEGSHMYQTSSEIVIRNGSAALRIYHSGMVIYEGEYAITSGSPTSYEMVAECHALAQATLGLFCGDGRVTLSSIQEETGGWSVEFCYILDGGRVWLDEQGYAARFTIRNGVITEAVLHIRQYTLMEDEIPLLPLPQAVAAMTAMGEEGKELAVAYQDMGGDRLVAGWIAVEP